MKSYVLVFTFVTMVYGQQPIDEDCRESWVRAMESKISLTRLRHMPPSKVVSAFSKAAQHAARQRWASAANELQRAVALDPDFSEAHSNLGVHYMTLGRADDAAVHFMRAVEIDDSTSLYHSNLAAAFFILGRYAEGEREARKAIAVDSSNRAARFLLGWELARRGEADEAIGYLQHTACAFPEAHEILAAVWTFKGDRERAGREMSAYRRRSAPAAKTSATGWVSAFVGAK